MTHPHRAQGAALTTDTVSYTHLLGYKDFVITQFQGLLAPAGTDPRIIATLHDAVVQAVKDPEVVRKLATEGGNEIIAGTPEEFTRQLRDDLQPVSYTHLDVYKRQTCNAIAS